MRLLTNFFNLILISSATTLPAHYSYSPISYIGLPDSFLPVGAKFFSSHSGLTAIHKGSSSLVSDMPLSLPVPLNPPHAQDTWAG